MSSVPELKERHFRKLFSDTTFIPDSFSEVSNALHTAFGGDFKGGNLPPPFGQFRIAPTHIFEVTTGILLSLQAATTSTIAKYHSLSYQTRRMDLSSNLISWRRLHFASFL